MISRKSSGSSFVESAVEPTRSVNITVSWRRSASSRRTGSVATGAEAAVTEGEAPLSSRIFYADGQSSKCYPDAHLRDHSIPVNRINNAYVLHSAFEFFAIVCGFDLKVVGDRDVAGIVGVVTYRPVVRSLRQSCLAQALSE